MHFLCRTIFRIGTHTYASLLLHGTVVFPDMSRHHMNFAIPHRTSSVSHNSDNKNGPLSRRASYGVVPAGGIANLEAGATFSSSGVDPLQNNGYDSTKDRVRKPVLDRISELSPRRDPDGDSSDYAKASVDSRLSQHPKQQSNHNLHELRQRASSPLLGQSYKRNNAPYSSLNSKQGPMRPSDSSSTLHSFYEVSKTTSAESNMSSPSSRDLALRRDISNSSRQSNLTDTRSTSNIQTVTTHDNVRQPTKQKHRPPMIDLSKLFPKPQKSESPLLSPTRMMASPSPVSVRSDVSAYKPQKFDRVNSTGNKLTKAPKSTNSGAARQQASHHGHLKHQQSLPTMHKYGSKEVRRDFNLRHGKQGLSNWFDGPEGQISDDDDTILEEWEGQTGVSHSNRLKPPMSPSYYYDGGKRDSVVSSVPSIPQSSTSKRSSRTIQLPPLNTYLKRSPSTPANSEYTGYVSSETPSTLVDSRWTSDSERSTKTAGLPRDRLTRKSSRTVLDNTNLNESSVLCLSSSEDECERQRVKATKPVRRSKTAPIRDSIGTLDDHSSAEIGVAQAVAAARRPSLRKIRSPDRTHNTPTTIAEEPASGFKYTTSASSSMKSSSVSSHHPSQRAGGVPRVPTSTKSQTPSHDSRSQKSNNLDPQSAYQNSTTQNRRSRFIAVTRQEEQLLEMMRRDGGAAPGSVDSDPPTRTAPGKNNTPSRQQDRSRGGLDTSFLALSPGLPPPQARFFGTPYDRDQAWGGVSDGDTSTDHSNSSLRTGLSDAFPSPSTDRASPRTPTLQAKYTVYPRDSIVPSIPPSNDEKRHSRTRTDSSNAIMFGSGDDSRSGLGTDGGLPIWALGWNHEAPGMAIIH